MFVNACIYARNSAISFIKISRIRTFRINQFRIYFQMLSKHLYGFDLLKKSLAKKVPIKIVSNLFEPNTQFLLLICPSIHEQYIYIFLLFKHIRSIYFQTWFLYIFFKIFCKNTPNWLLQKIELVILRKPKCYKK